jgi:hypothetical protein
LLGDLNIAPNSIPLVAGEPWINNGKTQQGYQVSELDKDFPGVFYHVKAQGLPSNDSLHFTNEGQEILGTRYGEKMYALIYRNERKGVTSNDKL